MNAIIVPPERNFLAVMLDPKTKEVANIMANSGMVPNAYRGKPADIIVAVAVGARIGLDALGSLLGIAVINGRPSVWGDAFLGVIMDCPAYEDHSEEWTGGTPGTTLASYPDSFMAKCTMKRKGREPKVATFSVAEAKIAGLWGKQGPWTTAPTRMLMMRARSFAGRDAFSDALQGFDIKEVLEDQDYTVIDSQPLADAKIREIPLDTDAADEVRASKKRNDEHRKLLEKKEADKAAEAAKATMAAVEKERKTERAAPMEHLSKNAESDPVQRGAETEAITKADPIETVPGHGPEQNPATPNAAEEITTLEQLVAYANRLVAMGPAFFPGKAINTALRQAGIAKGVGVRTCPPGKILKLAKCLRDNERYMVEMPPEAMAAHWTTNPDPWAGWTAAEVTAD